MSSVESVKIGRLVVSGVLAIIGGGIIYALFGGSATAVAVYEVILLLILGGFISN